MADNYLEKRYEACFGSQRTKVRRIGPTFDDLLLRNRSTRGYYKDFVVSLDQLEQVVSVYSRVPSARNQQPLRFRLVTRDSGAEKVLPLLTLGAALPELHLPLKGTEPEAFIVVCSSTVENRMVDIDLGIAAQSMLLKATSMGLNGLIVAAFNRQALREVLHLPFEPLLVIAIGKSAENIQLVPSSAEAPRAYYREGDVHYVPKLQLHEYLI